MGLRTRYSLIACLACSSFGLASPRPFSVYDDVLAFPQFDIIFPDEYILESEAHSRLSRTRTSKSPASAVTQSPSSITPRNEHPDNTRQTPLQDEGDSANFDSTDDDDPVELYEEMVLHGQKFLCEIPRVAVPNDTAESDTSAAEQEKELARATDRGMELLHEMDGRCMYYSAGWWSYSFCYMNQVQQFHALLPGHGVPAYPPVEDPNTHSYVLGRFRRDDNDNEEGSSYPRNKASTEVVARESRGDSRYLVQYLEDGTICDLTGRPRKIEVQFHCHPQSTDHIGWIKEVSTCSYLMVVHTPRLCNDVAFQPPRGDQTHDIICREIITPEEVPEWEADVAAVAAQEEQGLLAGGAETYPVVGDIDVGAMKLVGKEGKRIEKGKVAFAGEEKVNVVARSVNGKYQRASKEMLKKLKLEPEDLESVRRELEQYSQGQDWKLEMVDMNGELEFRGVIDSGTGGDDGESEEVPRKRKQKASQQEESEEDGGDDSDSEVGSEETYKEEL